MKEAEHVARLMKLAVLDLKASENMGDPEKFSDQIFSFHIQQAIEKALKSLIGAHDADYPHTHNLGALMNQLEGLGENLAAFRRLEEYTAFAAQIRYEDFHFDELGVRQKMCDEARSLIGFVQTRITALAKS